MADFLEMFQPIQTFFAQWNWTLIGIWVGVGLSLFIYSFLYKDNPLFKLAEHLFVGLSTGYGLCVVWYQSLWPRLVGPLERLVLDDVVAPVGRWFSDGFTLLVLVPERFREVLGVTPEGTVDINKDTDTWMILFPVLIGVLILLRFSPNLSWMSRWSLAFITGAGAGIGIPITIQAVFYKHISQALLPLVKYDAEGNLLALPTFNLCVGFVGVIAVLVYFFFSIEHKGVVKGISRVGIFYLMVAFGAAFGLTVMARESLLIGRMGEMIKYTAADYYYAPVVMLGVTILLLVLLEVFGFIKRHEQQAR